MIKDMRIEERALRALIEEQDKEMKILAKENDKYFEFYISAIDAWINKAGSVEGFVNDFLEHHTATHYPFKDILNNMAGYLKDRAYEYGEDDFMKEMERRSKEKDDATL